jgi:hypothetical protein
MAVQTTFSMFQQLLKDAVDADANLNSTMKSALKLRVDALPTIEDVELTAHNVDSVTDAVVDEATDSILIPDTKSATVEWEMVTFSTPVRIDGTIGTFGALVGHIGQGSDTVVADADIVLQYRETASGAYKAFGRNVVIDNVSAIQIKATIATQTDDHNLPQLHLIAEQL